MQLRKEEECQSSIDFILNNLRYFLEKEDLDFIYMELGITFWDDSVSISTVGHGLVFFRDGKKGSLFFDNICDLDHSIKDRESYVQNMIRKTLSSFNRSMFAYSGKYWRYMTLKIDKSGKTCVKFYYDLREGKGMVGLLEKFD